MRQRLAGFVVFLACMVGMLFICAVAPAIFEAALAVAGFFSVVATILRFTVR